jgi:dipeptidyl aminopeptidase/acylaminoacyl peptidase
LHVENDMLIAEELHPERPELTGRAILVARGLSAPSLAAGNVVSASAELLAFQQGVARPDLTWFNRDGEPLRSLHVPTALYNPRLAPDGSKLVASSSVTTEPGLWLVSLDREEYVRLETDAIGPVWSPDGRRVAFTSRDGFDLYVRSIDGSEDRRRLTSDDSVKVLNDWSPDGAKLVFTRYDRERGLDLWLIDVGTAVKQPLLATPDNETQARISPDGRWIAYASDETGMLQVYVARFPDLSDRRAVSVDGGGQPQWGADQTELFYLALDRTLMAVRVHGREAIDFATPQPLFRAAVPGEPGDARDYFAVDASGEHFLVAGATHENDDGQAITILVDWTGEIPERQDEAPHISQAAFLRGH